MALGVPLNKRSLVVLLFVSAWLVNVIGNNSLGASSRIIIFGVAINIASYSLISDLSHRSDSLR